MIEIHNSTGYRRAVRWLLIEKLAGHYPQFGSGAVEIAKQYEAYIFGDGAELLTPADIKKRVEAALMRAFPGETT